MLANFKPKQAAAALHGFLKQSGTIPELNDRLYK